MQHFLLRLIPTRPTFPRDITDDERQTMMIHAAYWMRLIDQGVCVVYGPVLHPAETWGLSIVEVEGETEATELFEADPAVSGGLGTMEIVPMRLAGERKRVQVVA